jgi:hypothetical protein
MGGLYEAVIDELCASQVETANGLQIVRPKIVASTATVRRASLQMQALFGRSSTPAVFPAPGPDRRDSFFSYTAPITEAEGRIYLAASAPGRKQGLL